MSVDSASEVSEDEVYPVNPYLQQRLQRTRFAGLINRIMSRRSGSEDDDDDEPQPQPTRKRVLPREDDLSDEDSRPPSPKRTRGKSILVYYS